MSAFDPLQTLATEQRSHRNYRVFQEVNDQVRRVPDDLSKIPEIGLRHGIEFMPAPAS